jgi:hypothetical protein
MSALLFVGGPRGGKSGCRIVGVTALEAGFESVPERGPEEELEPELRDLLKWKLVFVRATTRAEGRWVVLPWVVGAALVKVRVKYWASSICQTDTIMLA